MSQKNLKNGSLGDFEFCPCGKIKGHKDKCLSFRIGKDVSKIGRYSGKSKSEHAFGDYQ